MIQVTNLENFISELLTKKSNEAQEMNYLFQSIFAFFETEEEYLINYKHALPILIQALIDPYFDKDELIPHLAYSNQKHQELYLTSMIIKVGRLFDPLSLDFSISEKDSKSEKLQTYYNEILDKSSVELIGIILTDTYHSIPFSEKGNIKISLLKRATSTFQTLSDSFNLAVCLSNLAGEYQLLGEFEISIEYRLKVVELLENDLNKKKCLQLYSTQKMDLADINTKLGKMEDAKQLSIEALDIEIELNNFYHIPVLHYNLGKIAYFQNNYDEAIVQFNQAIANFDPKINSFEFVVVNSWIIGYLVKIALHQGTDAEADELIHKYEAMVYSELSDKSPTTKLNHVEAQLLNKLNLAKAEIKQRSSQRKDKFEAEQIYENLSSVVEDQDERISVLMGKSELLIDELRSLTTIDNTIISELNENIAKLEKIAKSKIN